MDILDETNILIEAKYEFVVRNRKKVKRLISKPGFKIVSGKYKKMSVSEKIKRRISAKKGAKKRKYKSVQINRKRRLSMRKRKSLGLNRRR